MSLTPDQFLTEQRGEASFKNNYVAHARRQQLGGKRLTVKQKRTLAMLLPEQLAEVDRFVMQLQEREQQVAQDVAVHGALAIDWYTWQGHGDLIGRNGSRQRTTSRPQGGQPTVRRRSSRSTRGSPDDDDPSKPEPQPCEQPCDRLLFALRNSYPDAYRAVAEASGAWWARCPCAPDAGHTMFVMDLGGDREPGIACRLGCDKRGIHRMLGHDTPGELERRRRVAVLVEERERYLAWLAERRAS